ncbi:MAG: phosphatidyl-myo-inositol alpha-mannosyltransferase [Solirubrobacterales bacterium]|jgi:phosphatidylinositol alpha-mannosyltransferase|nr:phosphatidyl-myo-inositol alpha-mannosyltransferase [Solirubrobacterales bacterium]
MRIALTHAFCQPEVRRGAERFVPGLAAALSRKGHDVTHISAAWSSGTETVAGVRTVRLRRVFRDQFRHEADFGKRLLPRLALGRFDAVHSMGRHDAGASVAAARLHPRRRTMITDLGLPNPASWAHYGRREVVAAQRAVDGLDVYSCMSQTAVQCLVENYGRQDGVVVPGGVDLASFEPSAEREPNPTILVSGAITERRKGVPVLLEALPLIAKAEPRVELWLSGPGDPEEMLANAPVKARARTKVLGVGDSERQHERYGRAWITCLPSTHDSFGMALLESLACGTPIVATTHSAPKELVAPGFTGELCEPDDPRDLADACVRAFALTQRPGTASACRESAAPYDWDAGLAPLCEALYRGEDPPVVFPPRPPAEAMSDDKIPQIQ